MNIFIGFIIIFFILFIFPFIIGAYFITNNRRDIEDIYIYGIMVFILACLFLCYVSSLLNISLSMISKAIGIMIIIISISGIFNLYKIRKQIKFYPKRIIQYILILSIFIFITLIISYDINDICLKRAMSFIQNDNFDMYSIYSGLKINESTNLNGMAGIYAILSYISKVHVMIIGKWMMPIVASFLSCLIIRQIKYNFQGKSNYKIILVSIIFLCACLFACPWGEVYWIVHLLLCKIICNDWKQNKQLKSIIIDLISLLGIILCIPYYWYSEIATLFYKISIGGKKGIGKLEYYLCCILFCVLLYGILIVIKNAYKKAKNIKWFVVSYLLITYLIFNNLFYEGDFIPNKIKMADNLYKIDAEVMQIREMVEKFPNVKMLAPSDVSEQIRNMDNKVQLLYGPSVLDNPNIEGDLRIYEAAIELERNPYDLTIFIKNGLKFACNIVVIQKEGADLEFAREYGYQLLGETEKYQVYEFVIE